jgi:hypothetical protein
MNKIKNDVLIVFKLSILIGTFVIIPFVGNQTEFYLKLMFEYILKYLC